MYTIKRGNDQSNQNLTNLEKHFNYIMSRFNFDLYNVHDTHCIQLFDKEFFANDGVDCIAEFHGKSVTDAVTQAIAWINAQEQN